MTRKQFKKMVSDAKKGVGKGKSVGELPYIYTYSGVKFHHLDPKVEDIRIEDIAHALSRLNRFAGHITPESYSVAQHCVHVSLKCDPNFALEGLLHDAAEAYCVDVPRPLKRAPGMEVYRYYEDLTIEAINARFDLLPEPENIKATDMRMLLTEQQQICNDSIYTPEWLGEHSVLKPFDFKIPKWSPNQAEKHFIERFKELY